MPRYIRIADVKIAVNALGLICRYQAEYDEFKIDYRQSDSRWTEDSAYYTTYREDAIATAKVMAQQKRG